ncbi:MAG: hypothetical protein RLT87_06055 [Gammaproteobacteria bacterium]
MNYIRRLLRNHRLGSLLLTALVLRSLVATGYMLDTSPADGSLLSIKLCDGPAGIYKTVGDDPHQHHHADAEHDQHEQHELSGEQHVFSACSFWSSSSQLLLLSFSLDHLLDNARHTAVFDQAVATGTNAFTRTRFPRAPPTYS